MVTFGLAGWLFLIIGSLMIGVGIIAMTGVFARRMNAESCPFTRESILAAARWAGLSVAAFGLGLVSFSLMNKVLFTVGSFGCTVGLVTFLVMVILSRIVGARISAELVRKDESAEDTIVVLPRKDMENNDRHHDMAA